MYKVVINSFYGTETYKYDIPTEAEAKKIAEELNKENDNPYIHYGTMEQVEF